MTEFEERTPRILTIDDESCFRENIREFLEDFDYEVLEAENGRAGLEVFRKEKPDIVLVDLRMPEVDGLEVLEGVRRMSPETPVIVVSGAGIIGDVAEALRLGAWDYLFKPIEDLSVLDHAIRQCLERARLIRENRAYQQTLEQNVASRTRELQEVVEELRREVDVRTRTEAALRKSEERYRAMFDAMSGGVAVFDVGEGGETLIVKDFNKAAEKIFSVGREDVLGKRIEEAFPGIETGGYIDAFRAVRRNNRPARLPVKNYRNDKLFLWLDVFVYTLPAGEIVAVFDDVTKSRQAEDALRKSEEKFRDIFEGSRDAIFLCNAYGRLVDANEAAESLTGRDGEQLNRMTLFDLFGKDSLDEAQAMFSYVMEGESAAGEARFAKPDGTGPDVEYGAKRMFIGETPFLHFTARDVSERKHAEDKIRASLAEKEILLKEIHHRVKNNMQIISSLLNLQTDYVEDPQAQDLFIESRNRISSMALVHEELYRSKDLSKVDLKEYVDKLVPRLLYSFGETKDIDRECSVEDARLTIRQAIPLGLIINELVTNSLKHGFPARESGVVGVSIRIREGNVEVEVFDDGIGLPDDLDLAETQTLGMQLVTGLVSQLYGDLEVIRGGGARFRIVFPQQEDDCLLSQ